jgi:hypothetical protein
MNQTRHDEFDATRVSNRVADLPAFFGLTEVTKLVLYKSVCRASSALQTSTAKIHSDGLCKSDTLRGQMLETEDIEASSQSKFSHLHISEAEDGEDGGSGEDMVDERKFVCSDCGKVFKNTSKLNQHRAIHSGEVGTHQKN